MPCLPDTFALGRRPRLTAAAPAVLGRRCRLVELSSVAGFAGIAAAADGYTSTSPVASGFVTHPEDQPVCGSGDQPAASCAASTSSAHALPVSAVAAGAEGLM